MPRVSVVITTYNRSHFIPRAVASAHAAGSDVEVIVVDNGSSDDTPEVCNGLAGIRYLRLERNAGPGGGRNAGVRASTAEYVALLDDDDVRLPGTLDLQLAELERHPKAAFVYGRMILGDDDCRPSDRLEPGECPRGDIFWKNLELAFIPCLSVVARKRCLEEAGLFDPGLTNSDDWDMWLRLTEQYPVVAVDVPVGIYRTPTLTANNLSSNLAQAYTTSLRIQSRGLALPRAQEAPAARRRAARRRLLNRASDVLIWTGAEALEAGLGRLARRNLWAALRLNPLRALRPWTVALLVRSWFAGKKEQCAAVVTRAEVVEAL
jgi:Glycosyl transferase family 2